MSEPNVTVSLWRHTPDEPTTDDGEPNPSYLVVQIDTQEEPDDLPLRVYINDHPLHIGAGAR